MEVDAEEMAGQIHGSFNNAHAFPRAMQAVEDAKRDLREMERTTPGWMQRVSWGGGPVHDRLAAAEAELALQRELSGKSSPNSHDEDDKYEDPYADEEDDD